MGHRCYSDMLLRWAAVGRKPRIRPFAWPRRSTGSMAVAAWSSSPIGSAGPRRPFGSGRRRWQGGEHGREVGGAERWRLAAARLGGGPPVAGEHAGGFAGRPGAAGRRGVRGCRLLRPPARRSQQRAPRRGARRGKGRGSRRRAHVHGRKPFGPTLYLLCLARVPRRSRRKWSSLSSRAAYPPVEPSRQALDRRPPEPRHRVRVSRSGYRRAAPRLSTNVSGTNGTSSQGPSIRRTSSQAASWRSGVPARSAARRAIDASCRRSGPAQRSLTLAAGPRLPRYQLSG